MENGKLSQTLTELWGYLTDEQKEKAKSCASLDDLMQLAGEEGLELPLEMLEGVVGGYTYYDAATNTYQVIRDSDGEVLGRGYIYLDNAQTNARRQGQSTDLLTWDQLNALRNPDRGGC